VGGAANTPTLSPVRFLKAKQELLNYGPISESRRHISDRRCAIEWGEGKSICLLGSSLSELQLLRSVRRQVVDRIVGIHSRSVGGGEGMIGRMTRGDFNSLSEDDRWATAIGHDIVPSAPDPTLQETIDAQAAIIAAQEQQLQNATVAINHAAQVVGRYLEARSQTP
jgi:hypothetical protein